MKLPPQFSKQFQRCIVDKLPEDRFILETCDGKSWAVEVVNVAKDDQVYFREGWKEFVNDDSLGIGGLIVFEYQGDFKFDLDIFGNAPEKGYLQIFGRYIIYPKRKRKMNQPWGADKGQVKLKRLTYLVLRNSSPNL
ncbi:hypothetical protein CCACVL1_02297 [Corchorus capsularis]|uniref:TF-B3 domain-containing protein n=1 Tax=Corchorus capsularis TaxID=210143 RepID=A0A1R3K9L2_COCAP|nr:hypothetical protein CCACVL1_02297 [Corchorus capsularis]